MIKIVLQDSKVVKFAQKYACMVTGVKQSLIKVHIFPGLHIKDISWIYILTKKKAFLLVGNFEALYKVEGNPKFL